MKKILLFIFLVQLIKGSSDISVDLKLVQAIINKHSNENKISFQVNSEKFRDFELNICDFSRNGENLVVKTFIKADDIVIDAGAHVGGWTKSVLKATNNHCTIYAFEPVPQSFKALEKMKKGQNNNVFCFNVALGKEDDVLEMNYFFQRGSDCSTLFERPVLGDLPVQKIQVPVTYLDKVASENGIKNINFLKIDTEGCEYDVLMGAKKLIENNMIDVIQFEYGGTYADSHITLFQVYNFLRSYNYLIFRITSKGLIYIQDWDNSLENFEYSNYLALKA